MGNRQSQEVLEREIAELTGILRNTVPDSAAFREVYAARHALQWCAMQERVSAAELFARHGAS